MYIQFYFSDVFKIIKNYGCSENGDKYNHYLLKGKLDMGSNFLYFYDLLTRIILEEQ